MERHGRTAQPIDNPSIRKVLRVGESQYLTTRAHCDCGTVLVPRAESPGAIENLLAKDLARMRRKGWSEAKIARAVEGQRIAEARPKLGVDSLDLWSDVLHDLQKELKPASVGLLVRLYSGDIASEAFNASRRRLPDGMPLRDALASLSEDEVTMFVMDGARL